MSPIRELRAPSSASGRRQHAAIRPPHARSHTSPSGPPVRRGASILFSPSPPRPPASPQRYDFSSPGEDYCSRRGRVDGSRRVLGRRALASWTGRACAGSRQWSLHLSRAGQACAWVCMSAKGGRWSLHCRAPSVRILATWAWLEYEATRELPVEDERQSWSVARLSTAPSGMDSRALVVLGSISRVFLCVRVRENVECQDSRLTKLG